MKLTPEIVNAILTHSSRCTQAVLLSFGIDGWPEYASGCLNFLTKNGYTVTRIPEAQGENLMRFIKTHSEGKYLIATSGHALALHDGVVVDTAMHYTNPKRRIEDAWLVSR